ncbi:hypothetical protein OS493_039386, partial [Desmophyllum pertusum]
KDNFYFLICIPTLKIGEKRLLWLGNCKPKVQGRRNESGGADEDQMEVELLVEELVALEACGKESRGTGWSEEGGCIKAKRSTAVEMRNRALERVGQTRKRKQQKENERPTRNRKEEDQEGRRWNG